MKLRFCLLVILLIFCASHSDARTRRQGGKVLHRSKRTIGDIINWKLNLIQQILGGIGGLFGGGKSPKPNYGPPNNKKPSYGGRPQKPSYGGRPQKPSYGARPQKPSYGNQRPAKPRPNRPNYNQRPQGRPVGPSRPASQPQFGPSNAIKMLPAPNLATAAPSSGGGSGYQTGSLGSSALDTGLTSQQSTDTYGTPQAPPVSSNTDDYGSPKAAPIGAPAPPPASNTYNAPQSPASNSYNAPQSFPQSNALLPQSQYGSGATNTFSAVSNPVIVDNSVPLTSSAFSAVSNPVIVDNSVPFIPSALDSYSDISSIGSSVPATGIEVENVVILKNDPPAPVQALDTSSIGQSAPDSYGGAQFPVLPPVLATTARSFTVDYDDYDPDDVPIDQAAPDLPSYGISSTPDTLDVYGVGSNSPAQEEVEDVEDVEDVVIVEDDLDTYNSARLQLDESPAREEKALPSLPLEDYSIDDYKPLYDVQVPDYDDYDPFDVPADQVGDTVDVYGSAVAPVGTSAPVPDDVFTGDYTPNQETVIDLTDEEPQLIDVSGVSLANSDEVVEAAGLLPPVSEDYDEAVDAPVTPTSSPVLFTYAPSEGSTVEDLVPQLNIVVQSPESGGSLRDPLNVIPDEYEDYEYARDSRLKTSDYDYDEAVLGNNIEEQYPELSEDSPQKINSDPSPAPAFEDLRGIEFSTGSAGLELLDPEPTTYRAPIDFDLGTTAATGIEVDDVVLLKDDYDYDNSLSLPARLQLVDPYPDEYETEDETDYEPGRDEIPIVVEEAQPAAQEEEARSSYDPVVLLVGTPEKSDSSTAEVEEIPLFENALDSRVKSKRKAQTKKTSNSLKNLYNNWYGARNDWSRKIAKVQGRIRFKKLQEQTKDS